MEYIQSARPDTTISSKNKYNNKPQNHLTATKEIPTKVTFQECITVG